MKMIIFRLGRYFGNEVNLLLIVLQNLFFGVGFFLNSDDYKVYRTPDLIERYDFVIVGSGSAGSVLGGRLSEIKTWNILVLEAGDIPTPLTYVPAFVYTLFGSEMDWKYKSTPQKHSGFGLKNQEIPLPRGKTIGGTSAINGMLYVRGNRRDFDLWSSMGNIGWDYQSALKYFKKSEDIDGDLQNLDVSYHGLGGPMRITKKPIRTAYQKMVFKAANETGYSITDINGRSQIGFTTLDLTAREGVRETTAQAFLRPNLRRKNLSVLPNALVLEVLFDDNKKAIGVSYMFKNKIRIAYARKEVILSAGAFDSPKLLMISGIGPKAHLEANRIPVKIDLPGVGQNLMDHAGIFGGLTFFKGNMRGQRFSDLLNPRNILDYKFGRKGIYGSLTGLEINAFLSLSEQEPEWADLHIQFWAASILADGGFFVYNIIGYDEKFFIDYFGDILKKETFNLNPNLLRPKSRGSVTLRSRKATDPPVIDVNYLSHPDDLELLVKGVKLALRITNTTAFRREGIKFHDKQLSNCAHFAMWSDDYWRCYVRFFTSSFHHAAGTCKMAPKNDLMGVVDDRLRVYGAENLRVIDASIMPVIVSGNTNAATIMIGEKGADMIKEDWGVRKYLKP